MKQNLFMKAIHWLAGSADNHPGGASSKKLSAFWALVILATITQFVWLIWAYKHNDWSHLEYLITTDFVFAATGLGMNSYEKIKGKATIPNDTSKQDNEHS
jgi:hypothetical protein